MNLDCPSCGRPRLPIDEFCPGCRVELLSAEAAAERRREWESLAPATREEFERRAREFEIRRSAHSRWREWIRRKTVLLGGGIAAFVGGPVHLFGHSATAWLIADFLFGAFAGWLIHRARGGALQGFGFFFGAGVAGGLLRSAFSDVNLGVMLAAATFAGAAGYGFGWLLDWEHRDHSAYA